MEAARSVASNRPLWDCGSSLYDSFELKSFNRQLDSALHARTLSMPHLSDRDPSRTLSMPHLRKNSSAKVPAENLPPPPPPPPQQQQQQAQKLQLAPAAKRSRKISRSLNKILRSFFRMKPQAAAAAYRPREGFYVFCDKSGALTTIPESPEIGSAAGDHGGASPEFGSLGRRTASDRFTATPATVGISCA